MCRASNIFLDLIVVVFLLFLTFSALLANPKKSTLHGGQSRSWSTEQGKKNKKKSGSAPSPRARCSFGEKKKKKKKITRRIHMSRRYASRRHAGGLGPSRVRTRITTTRRLGQWVSLRNILRFRVRLQLSQSRCLSLLLAMSGRVFLFFPPRGHEPPPSVTASTQTSAFNAIVFQSAVMPKPRMSLCTQSVHSSSFPLRPLRTAPSRFPNMIRFGNRPPLIRRSVSANKSLLVRNF